MKILRRFSWLFWLLFGLLVGFLMPTLKRPALLLHQDAVVAGVPQASYTSSFHPELGGYLDIAPTGPVRNMLIFYPGGLVRPQAYEWLGVALSSSGTRTIIPVFPLDLAVTDKNRAAKLLTGLKPDVPVLLGGHSLGGAMVSSFLAGRPEGIAGLILMAAYPPKGDDLSTLNIPVLTLAAENDGLAKQQDIDESLKQLPSNTQKTVVEGSVHAFFGRYGPQQGDGLPTVTRDQAEQQILAAIQGFLTKIP
ncbi:alpha/beta hydrolase [Deinococcus roseus]|uniref:Carboxymethylenebutenolidase-like protein n=1 Tax=Deinococcus roseus TaxID=392414 RepID=A0ABQ2D0T6_9DEIO|nr:alpha/beta hydrolase [Deinococcus roseus]GGJ40158.1 carboxymethylenebutenolidase-like protein [Deinococcus roseus]